jgi:SpoVK/Ycf46/Vps4 family AAA+-type ATPase
MSENDYYKTSILDEIFKLISSLSFKNTSLDIVSSSSVSSFGTSILITGGPQSGKSSILEAVAEELKQLSLVDDILLITPEDLAIEFPGDTTRGLLQSILKYKGRTSTSNNKNEKEECKIVRKNVILLEDLDLITPSRGCSNDVVRVLMRELRNCKSTQTIILAASIEPFRIHSGILSMFEKHITLGLLNLSDRRDSLIFFTRKFFTKFNIKMDSLTTTNISLLFDLADTACLGFSIGDVKFVVQETIRRLISMKNEEELVSQDDFRMNGSAVTSLYIKELETVISDHTPYQLLAGGNSQVETTISLNKQRRLHPSIVDVIDYRDSYFKELSSNNYIDKGDNDNDDEDNEEEDFDSSNDNPRSPLSFSIADSIRPRNERTTFDDICGQLEAKSAIIESVLWQSNSAKSTTMKNLGISPATGLMLYGPPGTGKTMLAKAVAGTLRGRFIEIKIPNILSSGVGDSERALKAAFDAAQNAAPAVIFIDEIQALFCRRDGGGGGDDGDRMSSMLTSQLLLSLDSLHRISEQQPDIGRVIVIAATNVPEALDPALLRPGRFDKLIYVGLPTEIDRFHLFQQKNKVIFSQLDLKDVTNLSQKLAKLTSGCSCADIENIFRVAAMISVSEYISHNVIDSFSKPTVTEDHLLTAIYRIIN